MISNNLLSNITNIINVLIGSGLCIDQNFPYIRSLGSDQYEVTCSSTPPRTIGKSDYYDEMYELCATQRIYAIMLVDGGLLQIRYLCDRQRILEHRLAFLPCRDSYRYDDWQEEYNQSQLYLDIISSKVSVVPLRMDFDPSSYIEGRHPQSHVHLGFHKDCRIPVNKPVDPSVFCSFIIQHFYNSAFISSESNVFSFQQLQDSLDETIGRQEKERLYISV